MIMRFLFAIAVLAGVGHSGLAQDVGEELLPPEEAFRLHTAVDGSGRVTTVWDIADGYYLYRDKLRFNSETPGYELGPPEFPPGEVRHDEFFGDVETYRGQVRVPMDVSRDSSAPDTLQLSVESQGCADIGVCYPPQVQVVSLDIPPAPARSPAPPVPAAANPLAEFVGALGGEDEFLPPDEAFQFQLEPADDGGVVARWRIADGYYLYRDKIGFSVASPATARVGAPDLPAGKIKRDEFFGEVEVYYGDLAVHVPVTGLAGETPVSIRTGYQGCAEAGICYPPIEKTSEVILAGGPVSAVPPSVAPAAPASETLADSETEEYSTEQDRIAGTLASGSTWLTVVSFFGFGLLLAFTPCVFPMIPILSGIIVGQGREITGSKAFALSLVYVLAMALTYTVAGVIVGLSGENVQAWFQNPWVLSVFAAVFVLLSLSMFGFYELQMPSAIQSRLSQASGGQRSGTLLGAGIMGFLSALIVGPCVTAPLIGALIYIAQTGDALLGGVALFALSMGMGAPLLLIGTSAGRLLPKAGAWMEAVKAVFGVMLLAVAIWLLERILPIQVIMLMAGGLAIVSAVYLGALDAAPRGGSGWRSLWKGVGLVLFLYGSALLIGALAGGHGILQPLRGVVTGSGSSGDAAHAGLEFRQIKGVAGLDAALKTASAEGRPVMLDFYADWCVSCKEMEAFTFTDPGVRQALDGMLLLQADVTPNDAQDRELLKRFGLFGPPAILFFNRQGQELSKLRVVGYQPAPEFKAHVDRVRTRADG